MPGWPVALPTVPDPLARLVLDSALKGALIFTAAGLAALAIRRRSAAARHLVWTLAAVASLALPVLSAALPAWDVPLGPVLVDVPGGEAGPSPPASFVTPGRLAAAVGKKLRIGVVHLPRTERRDCHRRGLPPRPPPRPR